MIEVNALINLMQKSLKTDYSVLSYIRLKFKVMNIIFRIVVYQLQTLIINNSMCCNQFLIVLAAC